MSKKLKLFIRKNKIVVFAFIFALIIKMFFFEILIVDGVSMSPTLNNKDIIFFEKFTTKLFKPNLSDIVVVKNKDKLIIKRIVAKENDNIEFKNNAMYINGNKTIDGITNPMGLKTEVLRDYYYIMGDNKNLSVDSRQFGAVHRENIVGRYLFKVSLFN